MPETGGLRLRPIAERGQEDFLFQNTTVASLCSSDGHNQTGIEIDGVQSMKRILFPEKSSHVNRHAFPGTTCQIKR